MKGQIKTYLPEKQYGFISGADQKDYYFRASDFTNPKTEIADGLSVEFDQLATPKGYRAQSIVLLKQEPVGYVVPNEFILSRQNQISGWDIIEKSDWIVAACSHNYHDHIGDVREELKQKLKSINANAIINLTYSHSPGSEISESGEETDSVHTYVGRAVSIGKKQAGGTITKQSLMRINSTAQKLKSSLVEKTKKWKGRRNRGVIILVLFFVGRMLCNNPHMENLEGFLTLGAILSLIYVLAVSHFFVQDYDNWLEKKD
jgi:cold shock CspA family protein